MLARGMVLVKTLKIGLSSNLVLKNWSQMMKLRFLLICSRQRISALNETGVGKLYCPLFINTTLFGRSRGLSGDT